MNKKNLLAAAVVMAAVAGVTVSRMAADDGKDRERGPSFEFREDSLVLSRSVYMGSASTVTVGQTLPPGCVAGTVNVPLLAGGTANVKVACATAVDNGEYPNLSDAHNVFNNDGPDGSFGVTSPRNRITYHATQSRFFRSLFSLCPRRPWHGCATACGSVSEQLVDSAVRYPIICTRVYGDTGRSLCYWVRRKSWDWSFWMARTKAL